MAKPIPEGFHSVTPSIFLDGCREAIEWYKRALGAQEVFCMSGPDGKVMHAEIRIGTSIVMLSDANPAWGAHSPKELKGRASQLYLYTEDVDATFQRALDAGATSTSPVQDMFWGDRMGNLCDPFGHHWGIATHTQDLTPEEIDKGREAWMARMAACSEG